MKKIERTVERLVKEILKQSYDDRVMEMFWEVKFLKEVEDYDLEAIKKYAPYFYKHSFEECKEIINLVNKRLIEEIEKPGVTFLKTVRALEVLEVSKINLRTKNHRIKFCIELKKMENCYCRREFFKMVSLIDKAQ